MRFGTHHFAGDAGMHTDPTGQNCQGRVFKAIQVGYRGAYANKVGCTTCHREIAATEDRLMPETQWTSLYEAAIR